MAALLLAASCASIGNPSGGPRDEDPPKFVTATPLQGSVEVSPTKAVLTFDELVTLKDAFTKVVVSPPSAQVPRVSSLGRRVTVEFRDSLKPNTTYTVDFGDAIVDNNEGNKLENFIYTFSTGPVLDTLMVSGMVFDALDLTPSAGFYVGLHSNPNDSAFKKSRFDHIAKTDEQGRFVIGGLAPGQYRIYALEDKDGDMAWSSPEESLAFYDTLIEPRVEQAVATDTIFNMITGAVDTVMKRERVKFVPNNILLRSFNSGYKQQYITKYERVDSTRINFIFNAPADALAKFDVLTPAGRTAPMADVAVIEKSATNDTLSFWLRDKEIFNTDTLRVAVEYLRADSAYNMVPVNDTVRLITQRPKVKPTKAPKAKTTAEDSVPKVPTFEFKVVNNKVEVNGPIVVEAPFPTEEFDFSMINLATKPDSVWIDVADFDRGKIRYDSLNPRRIIIDYPWQYETQYRLTVDSLAARNIYGIFNANLSNDFTTRKESDYSSLQFDLTNVPPGSPAFVELIEGQDKVTRRLPVENDRVLFEYLLPGKYNARIVIDANGNGRWDPGNFDLGLQPDVSYYYPQDIELKQNWSQELDWNIFSTPVDKMRPQKSSNRNSNLRR